MPKGQAKMADKNVNPKLGLHMQTNSDKLRFRQKSEKSEKIRQIQTKSVRQIQTNSDQNSHKFRKIQTNSDQNSDKFRPHFGLNFSEFV